MLKNTLNFGFLSEVHQQSTALKKTVSYFDSAAGDAAQQVMNLDDQAFNHELMVLRRSALFAVFQLTSDILDDHLDDDELPSDRLDAYLSAEIQHEDSEAHDLETHVMQIKAAFMSDAMSSLGVEDDTITKAFGTDVDEADEAIIKISETIEVHLPTGDDLDEFITAFLYGDDSLDMEAGQVEEYDSTQFDKIKIHQTKSGQPLVYRGVKAVRHGKIAVVNKRIGDAFMKVKLSSKQKEALRKAAAKAVAPNAIKKRIKSLKTGLHNEIYKQK